MSALKDKRTSFHKIVLITSYTKIEDKFTDTYLTKDDETLEEAKARLKENGK